MLLIRRQCGRVVSAQFARQRLLKRKRALMTVSNLPLRKQRHRNRRTLARAGHGQNRKKQRNQLRQPSTRRKEFQRPARLQSLWWTRIPAKFYTKKMRTRYEPRPARKKCSRHCWSQSTVFWISRSAFNLSIRCVIR